MFSKKPLAATPYQILGVDPKASLADIKRAYFKRVREFPPEEQPEKFKEIRKAYDQLKSPEEKALVDMFLLQPAPDITDLTKGRYDVAVHPEDMIQLALEYRLDEISVEKDFYMPETL